MEPVDPETILELDAHLSEEIDRMSSQQHRKVGGPQQVASILNHLHQDGQRILDGLGERQPQLAEDIRALMFTFEDLSRLDDRAIQELIKVIPRSTLTLALRGVPDNLSQLFYKNMSSRSAETMREDLIAMGAQKKEDVLRAQRDILDWVKKLEDQGKIVIERGERQVI
jgi:flagellar motor switch protein FliG